MKNRCFAGCEPFATKGYFKNAGNVSQSLYSISMKVNNLACSFFVLHMMGKVAHHVKFQNITEAHVMFVKNLPGIADLFRCCICQPNVLQLNENTIIVLLSMNFACFEADS